MGEKGDSEKDPRRNLFVRNLPYSTSDDQLSAVFGKYGAIKSCFTVKEKGVVDRCKGYGYVLFEKKEDAERAKGGVKKVKGRVVQIVFADKRPVKDVRKTKEKAEKHLSEEAKPLEDVDDIESESDSESDYEALTARDDSTASFKHRKPKTERRQARYDVGRVVVVTGIPKDTVKSKLRKKFSKYGPLEDFVYPVQTVEEVDPEKVNGLIAHVTYKNYADARKAVKTLEGLKLDGSVNPLMAILMSKEGKTTSKMTLVKSRLIVRNLSFEVAPKDLQELFSQYGRVQEVHIPRKPNGHMRGYAFVQFTSYFDATKALEGVNGMAIKGRPVAVDWVVPKTRYEASLQMEEDERRGEEEEDEEEKDNDEDGNENECQLGEAMDVGEREGGVEDGGGGVMGSECEDDESVSSDEEEGEGEEGEGEEGGEGDGSKKPFKADVHEGKTVFVRNLPLESSEVELKQLFSRFGRVRYARIVRDKDTGLSRGTAFIQFIRPSSLQQCLESSDTNSESEVLLYNGRQLDVSLALSPQELEQMRERGEEKTDKRNLYLAKEGAVLPGTEAAEGLSKTELAKRLKAQAEKKSKLANTNFYVSRTRLSVRNLPTNVTEPRLKEIFTNAIDTGRITQLKILRSKDRVDSQGVGRSRGFAFVEFSTHTAALTALRATNNNPSILQNNKRLIVEFAVEDARIMRARELKKRRSDSKRSVVGARGDKNVGEGEQGEGGGRRGTNKKVEWQLKCKEKRLRRREQRAKKTVNNPSSGAAVLEDGVCAPQGQSSPQTDPQNRHGKRKDSRRVIERTVDVGRSASNGVVKPTLNGRKRKTVGFESDNRLVGGAKGGVVSEGGAKRRKSEVESGGADIMREQKTKLSGKQSRRVRKGGSELKEERAFLNMVDTYRRKLLHTSDVM